MNGDNNKVKGKIDGHTSAEKTMTVSADEVKRDMTNDTAQPTTTGKAVDNAEQYTETTAVSPQKTGGGGLFTVLLLLVLATVGGLTWYGWTNYLQPQQQRLQVLEESISRQLELSDDLNNRQQSAAKERTTAKEQLASLGDNQKLIDLL